jgi:hypothetical protein
MKVKELIKLLFEQEQEAEVVLSSDAEGNGFDFCQDYSNSVAIKDGEVYDLAEAPEGSVPCVVLWP